MVTVNRMCATDGHIPILDDIYAESSTQKAPLGTRMMWADGRVYKYMQAGGTHVAGELLQNAAPPTGWDTSVILSAAAAVGVTVLACSATAGTAVQALNTSVTAMVDGFIGVKVGGGSGIQYQVKSHTTISSNSAFTMTLYDPVAVAMTTVSTLAMTRHPFKEVIIAPVAETGGIVGAACIATTDTYYAWMQTWGIGLGKNEGAGLAGFSIARSTGTAGDIVAPTTAAQGTIPAILGEAIVIGVADNFGPVFWKISP